MAELLMNLMGPAGAQGPAGPEGPQGPNGLPGIVPYAWIPWTGPVTNMTLGTGGTINSKCLRLDWGDYDEYRMWMDIQLGTGGAFTGDTTVTLPATSPDRFVGAGVMNSSARMPVSWFTINRNSSGALVRPHWYAPTGTAANAGVNIGGSSMGGSASGTWDSGDWLSVWGSFLRPSGQADYPEQLTTPVIVGESV